MICGLSKMTCRLRKLTFRLPEVIYRQIVVILILWNLLHSSSSFGLEAMPVDKALTGKEVTNSSRALDDVFRWKRDLGLKLGSKMFPRVPLDTGQQTKFQQGSTEFMISLFDGLLQGKQLVEAADANQTDGRTHKNKLRINTVRCLLAKGKDESGNYHFNLPELPQHEHLRMAKLSLQRNQTGQDVKSITLVLTNKHMRKKIFIHRLPLTESKEIQFDFTKELSSALSVFKGNMEIEIRLPKHIRNKVSIPNQDNSFAPILVIYSEDETFVQNFYNHFTLSSNFVRKSPTSTRRKRSTNNGKRKKNRRRRKNRWRKNSKQICKVHEFIVDFDLIGWGPWIIHPKTFNAKLCHGQCPSPIGPEYSPTNHAMLQSLMTMKRPLSAPSPCCVATKLRPLSMLYFEYDDIVVRHHEDMIVDQCGCR